MACWFDVLFDGSREARWLSTAPGFPTTHWFQLRCLLPSPLPVVPGLAVEGTLALEAHPRQSYSATLRLAARGRPTTARASINLKEPYYRQSISYYAPPRQATQEPT